MKKISIIILFLLISSIGYSQHLSFYTQNLSKEGLNLKGKVKSIVEISYTGELMGDEYVKVHRGWESNWQKDSKSEFDTAGYKVFETFYISDTQMTRVNEFIFSDGKLLKSDMSYHTRTFAYDSCGRLVSMKQINKLPDQISTSDANNSQKENFSIYQYTYDDNNNLTEEYEFDSNGKKLGVSRFVYDENGRLILNEEEYNGYRRWFQYSYDSVGNLIEELWSDSIVGILERMTFDYENNVRTKEVWETYFDGILDGIVSYTYLNGNEKEVIETDGKGNVEATWSYQYEYDLNGNWIVQIGIIDNEEIYIVEREIEYY